MTEDDLRASEQALQRLEEDIERAKEEFERGKFGLKFRRKLIYSEEHAQLAEGWGIDYEGVVLLLNQRYEVNPFTRGAGTRQRKRWFSMRYLTHDQLRARVGSTIGTIARLKSSLDKCRARLERKRFVEGYQPKKSI